MSTRPREDRLLVLMDAALLITILVAGVASASGSSCSSYQSGRPAMSAVGVGFPTVVRAQNHRSRRRVS
jgi:hypothetical protein